MKVFFFIIPLPLTSLYWYSLQLMWTGDILVIRLQYSFHELLINMLIFRKNVEIFL